MGRKEKLGFVWAEYFSYKDWPYAVCKICHQVREDFDGHHVVPRGYGGKNSYLNVLRICKTCHSIISFGNNDDAYVRQMACIALQQARFGLHWQIYHLKMHITYDPDCGGEGLLLSLANCCNVYGRWKMHVTIANNGYEHLLICQAVLHDGTSAIKRFFDTAAFTQKPSGADIKRYLSGRIPSDGMSHEALELLRNERQRI